MILLSLLLLGATVEERVMDDQRTIRLSVGGVWLSRFDLMASPGVGAQVSHYLTRDLAIDYLSGHYLFTFETPEAGHIRVSTGFTSDREKPRALIGAGARYAFGYGKVLIAGTVLHFIPEAAVHLGIMLTDAGVRFAFDAGLGLRVHLGPAWSIGFDYQFVGSVERKFVPGGMPRLSLGYAL